MFDEVAQILAHPLRQRLLFEYDEPTSPSQVARRLDERVNVISYHTNVLRQHGWIELVSTARRRGATEHYYRSAGPPDIEDEEWGRVSPQLRRAIVLGMLAITGQQAHAAALQGGFDGARAHLSRSLLDLDEQGVDEAASTLRQVVEDLKAIAQASRDRRRDGLTRHEVVIEFYVVAPRD